MEHSIFQLMKYSHHGIALINIHYLYTIFSSVVLIFVHVHPMNRPLPCLIVIVEIEIKHGIIGGLSNVG